MLPIVRLQRDPQCLELRTKRQIETELVRLSQPGIESRE